MELLFLLLLPVLGALVGDGTSDDDSAEDDEPASPERTASQIRDLPEERLADDEEPADQVAPTSLPGGDWSAHAAATKVAPEPALVADFNGIEERLILEIDRNALPDAAPSELEASTDAETGDVTLSLAGQKLATLAAPRAFDLAQVSLRAV